MIFVYLVIAVCIGAMMPVQATINAALTKFVGHPYLGALISFTIGTLAMLLLNVTHGFPWNEMKRITLAPPHYFLGGILGALFVGSSIFLIPKMGATTMIAAFVTGQLLMSLIIDHFGLLGISAQPTDLQRIIGVFLLFAGLFLVVKKGA